MPYSVHIKRAAVKDLERLDGRTRTHVDIKIQALARDPRPKGCKKLREDLYRIRSGPLRVVYRVQDEKLEVLVILVGGRGDVYARLDRM